MVDHLSEKLFILIFLSFLSLFSHTEFILVKPQNSFCNFPSRLIELKILAKKKRLQLNCNFEK